MAALDTQLVVFMKNKDHNAALGMDLSVNSNLLAVGNHWKETEERSPKSLFQQDPRKESWGSELTA